jgi:CheY-like chemotaxis protein
MANRKILIVDDDIEFAQELQELLLLSGYEAKAVNRASETIQAVAQEKPDVILLDLKMDGMSGFEVAKGLRSNQETRAIPIIAMSGYYDNERDAALFNFFDLRYYLQKPFKPLNVIIQIESLFEYPPNQ